jgi:hypothetical protein
VGGLAEEDEAAVADAFEERSELGAFDVVERLRGLADQAADLGG